ncbi:MAG: tight adherence protein [Actinomycetota bacterium]|jgi:tight adherence protein C|nr:tight adherence protein [Actinomycetota bacterium]
MSSSSSLLGAPLYVWAAALAVVLSVPVLWFALAVDRVPGRRANRNLTAGLTRGDVRSLVLPGSRFSRLVKPVLDLLARPIRRLTPGGMLSSIERRIELAGLPWSVERVLVVKLGGGLTSAGLLWGAGRGPVVTLFAGAVGYLGPDTVLARRARTRQLQISNELPDMLDQLTICVEAGLGFDAALARVSRSGDGPLSMELTRLLQDLRIGVPRADALDQLLGRTDVAELRQFVHAVLQADKFGVSISKVLRSQAVEQREKRRFRAEERAMKLPVKVIFPLVFCIMPVIFIVVLGPAYVHLTTGLK